MPWKTKKLSEIGDIFNGNSINENVKKNKYLNIAEGLPFIATKDISYDHKIAYENGVKIPFTEKNSFKIAPKNTILICAEGGSAGRKIAFTDQDICFGNKLFALKTIDSVDSKFVYYWYFSTTFQKEFKSSLAGIIGGVSLNKFKDIQIPVPPLNEQQGIVTILDEAFAAIAKAKENTEKNLQNAKELFESYLQTVFKNIGDDSVEEKMVDVCSILTCGVASTPKYVDEKVGVPFLSAQNVKNGEVVLDKYNFISKDFHEKLTKKNKPKKGDILYSRVGAKYGEAGVVEHDFDFSVYVSVTLIRTIPEKLNNYYLKYYLNSPLIKSLAKKTISSSGVPNLNVSDVREFPIKYPPLAKQNKTVNQIKIFSAEIRKLESIYQQKLADLEELKKSILQKAFNGELAGATYE